MNIMGQKIIPVILGDQVWPLNFATLFCSHQVAVQDDCRDGASSDRGLVEKDGVMEDSPWIRCSNGEPRRKKTCKVLKDSLKDSLKDWLKDWLNLYFAQLMSHPLFAKKWSLHVLRGSTW